MPKQKKDAEKVEIECQLFGDYDQTEEECQKCSAVEACKKKTLHAAGISKDEDDDPLQLPPLPEDDIEESDEPEDKDLPPILSSVEDPEYPDLEGDIISQKTQEPEIPTESFEAAVTEVHTPEHTIDEDTPTQEECDKLDRISDAVLSTAFNPILIYLNKVGTVIEKASRIQFKNQYGKRIFSFFAGFKGCDGINFGAAFVPGSKKWPIPKGLNAVYSTLQIHNKDWVVRISRGNQIKEVKALIQVIEDMQTKGAVSKETLSFINGGTEVTSTPVPMPDLKAPVATEIPTQAAPNKVQEAPKQAVNYKINKNDAAPSDEKLMEIGLLVVALWKSLKEI